MPDVTSTEEIIEEAPSSLSLSDDDWANLDTQDTENTEEVVVPSDESEDAPTIIPDMSQEDIVNKGEGASSGETAVADENIAVNEEVTDTPTETDETPNSGDNPPDYETMYKQITAPFRANGKEMQIDNAEDAIQLMQMGAGYNKKMAALKPNLKLLRLLDSNGLLDEEKLSFLIDVDKKNPEALAKLFKDSKLDPLDIDTEAADAYKAPNYNVDDAEVELDNALKDIEDSPGYNKTLNIVGSHWDTDSKQTVLDNPGLVRVINDHINSGVYDVITTELEKERVFGRVNGLSDIEAYRKVGDALEARGGFAHLFKTQGQQTEAPVAKSPSTQSATKAELKEKRRAVQAPKASAPTPKATNKHNPLSMSDEEFAKQSQNKFL